jgi:hypothetical protein
MYLMHRYVEVVIRANGNSIAGAVPHLPPNRLKGDTFKPKKRDSS